MNRTTPIYLNLSTTAALIACLGAAAPPRIDAEVLLEETHAIAVGWNFIRVAVEPLVQDPVQALAGIDWTSLWTWIPEAPPGRSGRWVGVHKNGPGFSSTLQQFAGPASYAILASSPGNLRINGRWRPDRQEVRGYMYQLYGPKVPAASPPTLDGYFLRQGVADHIGPVHEFSAGAYRQIGGGDALRRAGSYWTFADQDLPSVDPLRIRAGFGGLHFDAKDPLQELELEVGAGDAPRQGTVALSPGGGPTGGTDWLDVQKEDGSFIPLVSGYSFPIPAGATSVRVVLRARSALSTQAGGGGKTALIEVSGAGGTALVGAELAVPGLQGIWIGEALVNEVDCTAELGGGFGPVPEMPISLILEVPLQGSPRLLSCAELVTQRDGRELRYRFQAAMFHQTVNLSGALGANGKSGTLTGSTALAAGHPLNPYRHRYNPEHVSGLDLQRSLTLKFGAAPAIPPAVQDSPLSSVGAITGVYEEEITGLLRQSIRVRGAFRLRTLDSNQVQPCATGQ